MTLAEKRQRWASRVAAFKASNQSASAWCAAQDVNVSQLYYWINKFKSKDEPAAADPPAQWLEVGEADEHRQTGVLHIKMGKATIEVNPGFNASLLSDVIRTLSVL